MNLNVKIGDVTVLFSGDDAEKCSSAALLIASLEKYRSLFANGQIALSTSDENEDDSN